MRSELSIWAVKDLKSTDIGNFHINLRYKVRAQCPFYTRPYKQGLSEIFLFLLSTPGAQNLCETLALARWRCFVSNMKPYFFLLQPLEASQAKETPPKPMSRSNFNL